APFPRSCTQVVEYACPIRPEGSGIQLKSVHLANLAGIGHFKRHAGARKRGGGHPAKVVGINAHSLAGGLQRFAQISVVPENSLATLLLLVRHLLAGHSGGGIIALVFDLTSQGPLLAGGNSAR